eukprot:3372780-Prymnesium_polylepis.1
MRWVGRCAPSQRRQLAERRARLSARRRQAPAQAVCEGVKRCRGGKGVCGCGGARSEACRHQGCEPAAARRGR